MDSINSNPSIENIKNHFTNEAISLQDLPRFEEIPLHPLQPSYAKVVALRIITINLLIIGLAIGFFSLVDEEIPNAWMIVLGVFIIVLLITIASIVVFKKKAFAFREHDVIFRSGFLATKVTIIPYNRIQHVILSEGFFSRIFKLASVEMYTAGSGIGDLVVPGIAKDQAENIKQLLMSKIKAE